MYPSTATGVGQKALKQILEQAPQLPLGQSELSKDAPLSAAVGASVTQLIAAAGIETGHTRQTPIQAKILGAGWIAEMAASSLHD